MADPALSADTNFEVPREQAFSEGAVAESSAASGADAACAELPHLAQAHADLLSRLSRWQSIVPVLSSVLAVVSFVFGGLFNAHQSSVAREAAEAAEWRTVLAKVNFDDQNLVSSAFMLESFQENPRYTAPALQLETAMLARNQQPEMFDIVYWNMLSDSPEVNAVAKVQYVLDLGRSLAEQLNTEYFIAMKGVPEAARPDFTTFLQNPSQYLTGVDPKTASRVYVLLYELDTFSDSVRCIWDSQEADCPHVPTQGFDFSALQLVNHGMSRPPNEKLQIVKTCTIHHALVEAAYECI